MAYLKGHVQCIYNPLYNCALELGVKYPDKLEANTDYRSTCNVLETMWASTGFAIHHYLMEKMLEEKDIMKGENHLVKVWYLFYKWTSIWKGHKTGIRTGNFDMQSSHLAAFAPLFASGVSGSMYRRDVISALWSQGCGVSNLHDTDGKAAEFLPQEFLILIYPKVLLLKDIKESRRR